ncbi:MAG: hypothetical protein LBU73_08925 [Helicobacteraceae bacterium]|jgi:hypothetical protein|nr:hypothetical protein [Helicobacteraceae bacterium]
MKKLIFFTAIAAFLIGCGGGGGGSNNQITDIITETNLTVIFADGAGAPLVANYGRPAADTLKFSGNVASELNSAQSEWSAIALDYREYDDRVFPIPSHPNGGKFVGGQLYKVVVTIRPKNGYGAGRCNFFHDLAERVECETLQNGDIRAKMHFRASGASLLTASETDLSKKYKIYAAESERVKATFHAISNAGFGNINLGDYVTLDSLSLPYGSGFLENSSVNDAKILVVAKDADYIGGAKPNLVFHFERVINRHRVCDRGLLPEECSTTNYDNYTLREALRQFQNAMERSGVPFNDGVIMDTNRSTTDRNLTDPGGGLPVKSLTQFLFLPSEGEMFGGTSEGNITAEGAQANWTGYYSTDAKRIKKDLYGTQRDYFLSTPYQNDAQSFVVVRGDGARGSLKGNAVNANEGWLCPAFVVK